MASGPSATTSATTSWPGTCGSEEKAAIGLSMSPVLKSPRTSLASEPQMPERIGLVTTQSGRTSAGVVDVVEAEGDAGQHGLELVAPAWVGPRRVRWGAEEECLHRPPLRWRAVGMARMPTMKLSMSDVFISMTAFMSGR